MERIQPCPPADRIDINELRPDLAATICITGSSSNAGKTTLCESLLEALAERDAAAVALKVTRTHIDTCPRNNDGCGVCDDLNQPYRIIRDMKELDVAGKDTGRYLAAGAAEVLWLIVDPKHTSAGVRAALEAIPKGALLVAEGNSFRDHVTGDSLAIMAMTDAHEMKDSARHVVDRVDLLVGEESVRTDPGSVPWVSAEQATNHILDRLRPLLT